MENNTMFELAQRELPALLDSGRSTTFVRTTVTSMIVKISPDGVEIVVISTTITTELGDIDLDELLFRMQSRSTSQTDGPGSSFMNGVFYT